LNIFFAWAMILLFSEKRKLQTEYSNNRIQCLISYFLDMLSFFCVIKHDVSFKGLQKLTFIVVHDHNTFS
jgi:hypothetical protein